jgi:hypothetical protein
VTTSVATPINNQYVFTSMRHSGDTCGVPRTRPGPMFWPDVTQNTLRLG